MLDSLGVSAWTVALQTAYLGTGVSTTLLMQQIHEEGAGSGGAQIATLLTYCGMLVSGGLYPSREDVLSGGGALFSGDNPLARPLAAVSLLGVLSNAMVVVSIGLAGSGLFQIVYSSITAFVAIASRAVLGRRVSAAQWLAVAVVTLGLVISGMGSSGGASHGPGAPRRSHVAGFVASLVTTAMFAAQYVAFEMVLSGTAAVEEERVYAAVPTTSPSAAGAGATADDGDDGRELRTVAGDAGALLHSGTGRAPPLRRPTPRRVCFMTGAYGMAYMALYFAAYTLPNWSALVSEPMRRAGGSPTLVAFLYAMLFLSSLVHNSVYFALVGKTGALSTGILQALRGILVFGFSAALYCRPANGGNGQCLTSYKVVSCAVVIGGVLVYAAATTQASRRLWAGCSDCSSD